MRVRSSAGLSKGSAKGAAKSVFSRRLAVTCSPGSKPAAAFTGEQKLVAANRKPTRKLWIVSGRDVVRRSRHLMSGSALQTRHRSRLPPLLARRHSNTASCSAALKYCGRYVSTATRSAIEASSRGSGPPVTASRSDMATSARRTTCKPTDKIAQSRNPATVSSGARREFCGSALSRTLRSPLRRD
jgi:hypothetical protein